MPRRNFKKINVKRRIIKIDILNIEKNSIEKLGQKSITVEKSELFPSFKKLSEDREFIENPKIVEERKFSNLKNKKSDLQHKFDNENDPIYDLDEGVGKVDKVLPEVDPVIEYYSNYIDGKISTLTKNSTIRKTKMETTSGY
ncbi:MAG: hypothetical protein ACW99F_14350 [Candidatus Hodarchaeales archaeon]|jgi:hypothetical protein